MTPEVLIALGGLVIAFGSTVAGLYRKQARDLAEHVKHEAQQSARITAVENEIRKQTDRNKDLFGQIDGMNEKLTKIQVEIAEFRGAVMGKLGG